MFRRSTTTKRSITSRLQRHVTADSVRTGEFVAAFHACMLGRDAGVSMSRALLAREVVTASITLHGHAMLDLQGLG